jgi:hypothetical protein
MKHTTKDIQAAIAKAFKGFNGAVMDMEFLCWTTFMKLGAKSSNFARIAKRVKRIIRKSNKSVKGKYVLLPGKHVRLRECKE